MSNEPTNADILSAINGLSSSLTGLAVSVDRRFADADKQHADVLEAISDFSTNVDERFNHLESDVSSLKSDVSSLKSDMTRVKATMVTKDYLDEKMSDLRGDLVVLVRKEDAKVTALIHELTEVDALPEDSAERILKMEPFAR